MIDGNTALELTQKDIRELSGGRKYVFEIMKHGQWLTAEEVQSRIRFRYNTFFKLATVEARIRDLRKYEYGNHTVKRQSRCSRLYEYQLEVIS